MAWTYLICLHLVVLKDRIFLFLLNSGSILLFTYSFLKNYSVIPWVIVSSIASNCSDTSRQDKSVWDIFWLFRWAEFKTEARLMLRNLSNDTRDCLTVIFYIIILWCCKIEEAAIIEFCISENQLHCWMNLSSSAFIPFQLCALAKSTKLPAWLWSLPAAMRTISFHSTGSSQHSLEWSSGFFKMLLSTVMLSQDSLWKYT